MIEGDDVLKLIFLEGLLKVFRKLARCRWFSVVPTNSIEKKEVLLSR